MSDCIGMTRDVLRALREAVVASGLSDPYRAFAAQRNGAAVRGIGWDLTFAQWWGIWEQYYHLRGPGKNGLCMAREKDEGPYSVGNVYLTTNLGNLRDYHQRCARASQARKEKKERREIEFARRGTLSRADSHSSSSHKVYKSKHGRLSTCNVEELDTEW